MGLNTHDGIAQESTEKFHTVLYNFRKHKGTGKRGHIVADTLCPTQMFPRLPARATFVTDTNIVSGTQKNVFDFVQKHCVSARNVSQFARPRKHHEQQRVRNNASSFASTLTFLQFYFQTFMSEIKIVQIFFLQVMYS